MKSNYDYKGDEVMLFDTLTFNQQNCQHPELHTPAARRSFRPHHPRAATSCGDCIIHIRIDIGRISCRETFLFLQLQIAGHAYPAARQRQLITSMRAAGPVGQDRHGERTPVFITRPKLLISISGGEF